MSLILLQLLWQSKSYNVAEVWWFYKLKTKSNYLTYSLGLDSNANSLTSMPAVSIDSRPKSNPNMML
jgi:hypothetical protein